MLELLIQRSMFWKPKDFTQEIQQECSIITTRIKNILRCYYIIGFMSLLSFDLQPILAGTLPVAFYVPPVSTKYFVVLLWYLSFFTVSTFCGTDGFFCSLAASLWLQFKLLQHKIKENDVGGNESDKKSWSKMKQFVDRHVFLLK